jgi:hypothetical protein
MENIDVVMIHNVNTVFHVPRFGRIGRKLEVGVRASLQVYDSACFFFEFSHCTSQWVIDLASATPAGDKRPFTVPPIMNNQEMGHVIHCAHRNSYRLVAFARSSGI